MADRTIEDVLDDDINACRFADDDNLVDLGSVISSFYDATVDGPVFSADGSIAVHRTDPELAEGLSEDCRRIPYPDHSTAFTCAEHYYEFWPCKAVRAAALLAAPAPADPEEDRDG